MSRNPTPPQRGKRPGPRARRYIAVALGITCGLVLVAFLMSALVTPATTMTVHYRGQAFTVDRSQPEYTRDQAEEITALMLETPQPLTASNWTDLVQFHASLEVPGRGSSTGGFGQETSRGQFTYLAVELPGGGRHRVLIYVRNSASAPYHLFDEFMVELPYPPSILFEAGTSVLTYRNQRDQTVLGVKNLNSQP